MLLIYLILFLIMEFETLRIHFYKFTNKFNIKYKNKFLFLTKYKVLDFLKLNSYGCALL